MSRDPRAVDAFTRGIAATGAGKWDEAAKAFGEALKWDAGNPVVWYNRMCARHKLGDKDGALADARRTLDLDPKYPYVHLLVANILAAKNDYKDAIEHYVIAVEQDPENRAAHQNLGNAFEQLKLYEEAYACFEMALLLGGDRTMLLGCMHYAASYACRWDLTEKVNERLQWHLKTGVANHVPPFQALTIPGFTRQQALESARHTWTSLYGQIKPMDPPGPIERN